MSKILRIFGYGLDLKDKKQFYTACVLRQNQTLGKADRLNKNVEADGFYLLFSFK